MAKSCQQCRTKLGFFGKKNAVLTRFGSVCGFACTTCYTEYAALEAQLLEAGTVFSFPSWRDSSGRAPWLSSNPNDTVALSRRTTEAEALTLKALDVLFKNLRPVTPASARIFALRFSVYQPAEGFVCQSSADSERRVATLMIEKITSPGGDDHISIALHPSGHALLLEGTFGATHEKGSQVCYLVDTDQRVHDFYFYDR